MKYSVERRYTYNSHPTLYIQICWGPLERIGLILEVHTGEVIAA